MHRSHDIRADGIGGSCLCNAKIRHLDLAFCGNYNILRLDIPVGNLLGMRRFNPPCHLNCNTYCFFKGQLSFFFNVCLKSNSLYIFHDNIIESLFTSNIINIYYIRMLKSCRGLCFRTEFGHKPPVLGKFRF